MQPESTEPSERIRRAWDGERWRPHNEVSIALDDVGFLQGATVVDRLRTINHQAWDADGHVDRFCEHCRSLGIGCPAASEVQQRIQECVIQNRQAYEREDFSIVLLATPGRRSQSTASTFIVHPADIYWPQVARFLQHGQPLVTVEARSIPSQCWSPRLKTRSRLNYFLADSEARSRAGDDANGILQNEAGYLTETSIANAMLLANGELICSPAGTVLDGITQRHVVAAAESLGIPMRETPISVEMALNSELILLSGSTACLWPAASLNDCHFDAPCENDVFRRLQQRLCDALAFDFLSQAAAGGAIQS